MTTESRHLSIGISRSASDVYEYVSNPANLPEWAAGLGGSIALVHEEWVAESPLGRIVVSFVAPNDLGVLDHYVTTPDGTRFYNPLRVIADGDDSEVVFTIRHLPGVTVAAFEDDVLAIRADLASLKAVLER